MASSKINQENDTMRLFHRVCKFLYLACGTNLWHKDLYSPTFTKVFNVVSKIQRFISFAFVISGWGPFFTQHNLTEEQSNRVPVYAYSNTILYFMYGSVEYYRRELRELIFTLAVKLKWMYNDEEVEKVLIRNTRIYLVGLWFLCCFTLISQGFDGAIQSLTSNATFTTVIPVWPDVEDRRFIAGLARLLYYIAWWIFVAQVTSVHVIILTVTICVSHQFSNLYKYFESLSDIFEGSGSQAEKEKEYEQAFQFGIKMHSNTLWCTKQTQVAGGLAFSGQVLINVCVLVLVMMQLMYAERTITAVLPILFLTASGLLGTGIFMWNAGDITIEASKLPTAMYFSGWHNCQKSSARVRKMVTIAMMQAQQPELIKGFGFIALSYESYVTIVKSSYSLFSVIY